MIIVEDFDAGLVLQAIHKEQRHRRSTACPPCSSPMLNHPDFDTFDLSHLRTGIMAGSPCPPETMREVMDKMYMKEITICYGLTETSPVFTQTSADDDIEHKCETGGAQAPARGRARHRPRPTATCAGWESRASCAARATTS